MATAEVYGSGETKRFRDYAPILERPRRALGFFAANGRALMEKAALVMPDSNDYDVFSDVGGSVLEEEARVLAPVGDDGTMVESRRERFAKAA